MLETGVSLETYQKEMAGSVFGELVVAQTAAEKKAGVPERKIDLTQMGKRVVKIGFQGAKGVDVEVPSLREDIVDRPTQSQAVLVLKGGQVYEKIAGLSHLFDRRNLAEQKIVALDPNWRENQRHSGRGALIWINGQAITSKDGVVLRNDDWVTLGSRPGDAVNPNPEGYGTTYICRAVNTVFD